MFGLFGVLTVILVSQILLKCAQISLSRERTNFYFSKLTEVSYCITSTIKTKIGVKTEPSTYLRSFPFHLPAGKKTGKEILLNIKRTCKSFELHFLVFSTNFGLLRVELSYLYVHFSIST